MRKWLEKVRLEGLCIIIIVLRVYSVDAQHSFASVEECMCFAIEQNLSVKNARLDARISRNNYVASLGEFAPSVEAYGKGGKSFGRSVDPKTNMYTSTSFVESNMGLNVTLPLFEGFTRINQAKFERLNEQISRLSVEVRKNRIAFDAMTAFFNVVLEERLVELAKEQCHLSQKYKRQMEVFLETGLKSKADMQEMEARLKADIYQLTYRQNSKEMALLQLKQLLNLPESDSLAVYFAAEDCLIIQPQVIAADSLYLISLEAVPEAKALALKNEAARKKLAVTKGRFSPSISAEYSLATQFYNTARRDDHTVIPFSTQLDNNLNHYIGLSVSIPIFNGLKKITSWKNERLNVLKTANEVEEEKQQLRSDVENACLVLQASSEEYVKAEEQVRAEEINLRTIHRKWEEGLVSLFELMEVRNRFIAAKAEQTRTKMQCIIQQKTVRFYETGTFFDLNQSEY